MEVLEKLVNLPLTNPQIPDDPFFQKIRTEITTHAHLSSSSVVFTDEFREFIDKMIAEFIDEMKRRHQP